MKKLLLLFFSIFLIGIVSALTEISSWEDLAGMNNDLSEDYILMNDLNSSDTGYNTYASPTANGGAGWLPIGNLTNNFTGTFDGDGHTISDLYINRSTIDYIGLFGYSDSGSEISNVGLINGNITGSQWVGGLVGTTYSTTINSFYDGNVTCTGSNFCGGLFGSNFGLVNNSYSLGSVVGLYRAGGLTGTNNGNGIISNSYSQSSVYATMSYIGGFSGQISGGELRNVYSTGSVSGGSSMGGLVGYHTGGSSTNCFWDTQTSGLGTSTDGTGKTTAQMKDITTFSAWDIALTKDWTDETWFIKDGIDYARLGFEASVPTISYAEGTANDNAILFSRDYIFVNVSVTIEDEDIITFYLLDSEDNPLSTDSYNDSSRDITWTSLDDGTYKYYVSVNTTESFKAQTPQRTITIYNLAERDYPLFSGEIVYTGERQDIYDVSRSTGAGIGKFFEYLKIALPVLLVGLAFFVIIIIVGMAFKNLFQKFQLKPSKEE